MAKFNLKWNTTGIIGDSNIISQRASYRKKSAGGSFLTNGFTPSNDMSTSEDTTETPDTLSTNTVYEFKLESICTIGGPTQNSNGVIEQIEFEAIAPVITPDSDSVHVEINMPSTDITKVRFTTKKASDNVQVDSSTVSKSSDKVVLDLTSLSPSTSYYIITEFYALVNGSDKKNSDPGYTDSVFPVYPFTTDSLPVCASVTSITVTSIELI